MWKKLVCLLSLLCLLTAAVHAAPAPQVTVMQMSSHGVLAVGYDSGWVELWQLQPDHMTVRINSGQGALTNLTFSPDGQRLATVGKSTGVRLWNSGDGASLASLPQAAAPVAFRDDGTVLAGRAKNRGLTLWHVLGRRAVRGRILLPDQQIYSLDLHGTHAASAKGGWEVRLYTLTRDRALVGPVVKSYGWGGITGVTLTPDGHFVMVLGSTVSKPPDAFARVFDTRSGKESGYYTVGTNVDAVAASANGHTLVVLGSLEGGSSINVVNLKTGHSLWQRNMFSEVEPRLGEVTVVALSADGTRLITAGAATHVRVWDAEKGTVLSELTH